MRKIIQFDNNEQKTLQEAFQEFIKMKESLNKSPDTIEYYQNIFKSFRQIL